MEKHFNFVPFQTVKWKSFFAFRGNCEFRKFKHQTNSVLTNSNKKELCKIMEFVLKYLKANCLQVLDAGGLNFLTNK